jgi:hypothetical protein
LGDILFVNLTRMETVTGELLKYRNPLLFLVITARNKNKQVKGIRMASPWLNIQYLYNYYEMPDFQLNITHMGNKK